MIELCEFPRILGMNNRNGFLKLKFDILLFFFFNFGVKLYVVLAYFAPTLKLI